MWKDLLLEMVKQDCDEYETEPGQRRIAFDWPRLMHGLSRALAADRTFRNYNNVIISISRQQNSDSS